MENIGYAIPTSVAIGAAQNIIDYCFGTECESVQRPMLGVTIIISESRAVYNDETGKLRLEETVEVYEVSEGGLMARLLEVGDILVSAELNGQVKTLTRQHQIIDLMVNARVGDQVHLTVLRDGDLINIVVVLTEECLIAY